MKKVMLLYICMVFAVFTACSGEKDVQPKEFAVKVIDEDENAIEGVMLQLCKDVCYTGNTNENGVASFAVEIEEGYKLSVLSCPEGYEYIGEEEIPLEVGSEEYTLQITTVK